jgi:hypothetical protein
LRYLTKDYIVNHFIDDSCPEHIQIPTLDISYRKCNIHDTILPTFELVIKNESRAIIVSPKESLIYPTLVNYNMSTPSWAAYGLCQMTLAGVDPGTMLNTDGIFHFGQRFVEKYKTAIKYEYFRDNAMNRTEIEAQVIFETSPYGEQF